MALDAAIVRAVDASIECEASLRWAGLAVAASYAHDATATLRLALRVATHRRQRDDDPGAADGEALFTEDGRAVGYALRRAPDGRGELVQTAPFPDASTQAGLNLRVPATRDLGYEIASSAAAGAFAEDDLKAALLRKALSESGWIAARDRTRWSTSSTGAGTLLRILRAGRPAIALRPTASAAIEATVADLLGSVGWIPDLRRES